MSLIKNDFQRLWTATFVSQFGVLLGALSLTALVYLDATPTEMGILVACSTAPAILVALVAGVWVDRLPHRAVLLFSDYGRFALLLTVPLAAALASLRIEHLYLVAFVEGCLEVSFNLAYRAILPSLVESEGLVDANAKLRAAEALADSVAPTAGGALVQAIGAPLTVACTAASYLASGVVLSRLPAHTAHTASMGDETTLEAITGGLATVTRDARLRAILGLSVTYGFFGSFLITLYGLRILRDLDFSPLALGLISVGNGLGALACAGLVAPMAARLGLGRSLVLAYLLAVLFDLTIPLAGGPDWLTFTVLISGAFASTAFYVVENVSSMSLRQAITPPAQLGRVGAVFLVANRGLRPVGAVVAGVTAEVIGVQDAMFIGAAGTIGATAWLILSPIPRVNRVADALTS